MANVESRRHAMPAVVPIAAILALASVMSCRCIEHPLYDAKVNRFDTWYLGGGNTQYRPFRSVQYDPDAAFELELRHRSEGPDVVVAARLRGETVADLEGALFAQHSTTVVVDEPNEREELLTAFEHVDDDLALATIDRETLVELDRRGAALAIVFVDEVGATARLDLRPAELLDPHHPTALVDSDEEASR